jgi:hypothetical protein
MNGRKNDNNFSEINDNNVIENRSTFSRLKEYFDENIELANYKSAFVPLTQPLQVIMRGQQGALASKTNPRVLSAIDSAKEIYNTKKSYSSFFKGTTSAAGKEWVKCMVYKRPIIAKAPGYADDVLHSYLSNILSPTSYNVAKALFAGFFIAAPADTLLGGPLEALTVFRATSQGEHAKASYWDEVRAQNSPLGMVKRIYRGGIAGTLKSGLAFSTYFAAEKPINNFVRDMFNLGPKDKLSLQASFMEAFLNGIAVAVVASAPDIAKTQLQMPKGSDETVFQAMRRNYSRFGVAGLTAGLPIKFTMVVMGWAITKFAIPTPTQGAAHSKEADSKPVEIKNVERQAAPQEAHREEHREEQRPSSLRMGRSSAE